jgi:hypothetical protein
MRYLIAGVLAALLLIPVPALAQTATGTGTANSSSQAGAIAIGGGGGRSSSNSSVIFNTPAQQTINSNTRFRESGSLKTTPNAIAPGLGSAAVETCYGPGVSGGVSVTGFGASFGAGQWDVDCNVRLYSRTLFAMGYKRQAVQMLVNESPIVQRAFGLGNPQTVAVGYARPVSGGPVVVSGGGCTKWRGDVVGSLCLY